MIILYILCITYFLAINFYSFLLIKSYRNKEKESVVEAHSPTCTPNSPSNNSANDSNNPSSNRASNGSINKSTQIDRHALGKLLIAGALGGAITIYISMFLFKYKRENLLLMLLMPMLGVLNLYLLVLLFRFGFGILIVK